VSLIGDVRRWWFNNEAGLFDFNAHYSVDRAGVHHYGGPSVDFDNCGVCQADEWYARLAQEPMWTKRHECALAAERVERCSKQGNDAWANYHQDHTFAGAALDDKLDAPRAALLLQDCASQYEWFKRRTCSAGMATFRQKLAYVGPFDAEARIQGTDWSKYDWCWFVNKGDIALLPKPPVPMVLYCHDAWRGNKQEVLDHYRPEILYTPFYTLWTQNFDIPPETEVVFTPAMQSDFWLRPNLDDTKKKWDLLVIGALGSDFYAPRRELNEQLKALPSRFRVEHSHHTGSKRARWYGPMDDGDHCYMRYWMDKLGAARYVIFGPCAGKAAPMMLIKYYEVLASGAVPIMPDLLDMERIGLKRMVHFIPLDSVWGNMNVLEHHLDNYADYRYIAENAVNWVRSNAHDLVFGLFERTIRKITGTKYPARVL
jgi:hypothetical protein